MAKYGLYKNIETSTIRSEVSKIQSSLKNTKQDLEKINNSLTDSEWKANAKQTLLKAFSTINGEVYSDIDSSLSNLLDIASLIDEYKRAEDQAKGYISKLDSATEETSQSLKSTWETKLSECESKMDECVNSISGKN